jgi:hypothetical protein
MIYKNQRLAIPSNTEYSIPQLHTLVKEIELIINKKVTSSWWNSL